MAQNKAQEKYGEAVSAGHTAVMAEESDQDPEFLRVKVGNLLPN